MSATPAVAMPFGDITLVKAEWGGGLPYHGRGIRSCLLLKELLSRLLKGLLDMTCCRLQVSIPSLGVLLL